MTRSIDRLGAAVQNALELVRFGSLGSTEPTPYEVVALEPVYRLRRYPARERGPVPAVLLVPPLMITAEVYDISPHASAVGVLAEHGVEPWVVDFGAPEREEGGLSRTLADHVLAVSDAVGRVGVETGRSVHLAGYSQGGMFAYQAAAYRRSEGLASVITFGSPVDVHRALPAAIPEALAVELAVGAGRLVSTLFSGSAVPAWMSRTGFRLLDPVKDLRQQIEFLLQLYDREAIVRREGQRRFLLGEGWVAWPGPALRDFVEQILVANRMLSGGMVLEGRTVTLADITCPILSFVGEVDEIARPETVRAIRAAAPRAEIWEAPLRAGHFGLVVGSQAMETSWPTVAEWARWRDGLGEPPGLPRKIENGATVPPAAEALDGVRSGAEVAWSLGVEALRSMAGTARAGARALGNLATRTFPQLPRLLRLERVRRDTRIGLGLVLDERARDAPEDTFFLFEGRAYSYADANRRVDAVVRGLVSLGVRQGDHVGVLMRTRPSALALVAALSRLGAVAVMLRPDGPLADEIARGEIDHLVADPESAERARASFSGEVLVLGGGGAPRTLGEGLVDMERIDPGEIALPAWYAPNPGRAEELAMILFSGREDALRVNRITNRRWALSAFGTASAAALGSGDTVYCCTPVHHATGILVCVGGAVAGGARLAVATRFEASTFWDEIRRYGVTVVFYAGRLLREIAHAPHDPAERHHPVRLFAGSGLPRALWTRLVERFGPVGILEFYASTEGNAVLANLSGEKVGAVGRPLPGSAEVALARYDAAAGAVEEDAAGFARRCRDGETGLLLARIDRDRGVLEGRPLRGVFETGDAWSSTGDLFRRDADGDYWLVDHAADLMRTRDGFVPSLPVEDAIGAMDAVDHAVAYGVPVDEDGLEIPVAAVVRREGRRLDPAGLFDHVERSLEASSRPLVVRVVDEIPLTAGFRPVKAPLRAQGLDFAGDAWWLDAEARTCRPFDAAARERVRR